MIEINSQASDVFNFLHHFARSQDNLFAGPRYTIEAFSFPAEELQPELFLEQFELFTDTWLRGIQAIGGRRNV
jgi:hypothetical protein